MEMAAALTEYFFAKDFTPAARRWYEQKLGCFIRWCQDTTNVSDIGAVDASHVRRFLAVQRETPSPQTHKPPSSQTLHGYARALKAFLNFCVCEEWLSERVVRRIEMPKRDQKVIATFTKEHLTRLFAACDGSDVPALAWRDKAILAVLIDTGMRANELCTLTLDRTTLTTDDAYLKVLGKGRKEREVGLGKRARQLVHRYLHQWRPLLAPARGETHTFLRRGGKPLAPEGLDRLLYRLRDTAGVEHFTGIRVSAHTFRHTFAVQYLEHGGDVYKLSRLLGHTSVVVTEGYLRAFSQRSARQGASVLDTW